MPHITAAMQGSLRRGVGEILVDNLLRRTITSEVSSVKNTFSSWDNCMAATYCKWPVIAAIIVGGLIVFSIVACIVRCACCGMSCCCSCFRCLRCCDCCGDCCEGKREKPMKHRDDGAFAAPPPTQGYQAPAPMMGGGLAAGPGLGVRPEPPQYAQFEVGKSGFAVASSTPVNEDALPPMPSWEGAAKKHIPTEEEKHGVELGELDPATGQHIPLMSGAAATGISAPPSPNPGAGPIQGQYNAIPGQAAGGNGYGGMPGQFPQGQPAFNPPQRGFNGSPAPGQGGPRGFNSSPPPGQGGPGGFNSNAPGQVRGGPGRGYGAPQQGYDGQADPYGPVSPMDQYGQEDNYRGQAIGGAAGGYGRAQPQRQYSQDSRPFPPQPNRQYSSDSARPLNPGRQYTDRSYDSYQSGPQQPPRGPSRGPGGPNGPNGSMRMASPPLQNNSGFDFGGGSQPQYSAPASQGYQSRPPPPTQGYSSRSPAPQQMPYPTSRPSPPLEQDQGYFGTGNTPAPSYASRSPPPQEPKYPGYRAYQPPQSPAVGRGAQEPSGWDPVHQ